MIDRSLFCAQKCAFSSVAAEIAAAKGFRVLLCTRPTPTPTISPAIRNQQAAGGMNFTASHNPPEYRGIKFSTADGAPALPAVTKQIQDWIAGEVTADGRGGGTVETIDPTDAYLADLATKIRFDVIEKRAADMHTTLFGQRAADI